MGLFLLVHTAVLFCAMRRSQICHHYILYRSYCEIYNKTYTPYYTLWQFILILFFMGLELCK